MILVTIGIQEPFDRLIRAMDEIAPDLPVPVVAQAFSPDYKAKNIQTFGVITPAEFDTYFDQAQLIVAHAGMGTIINALVRDKPIVVLSRLMKYKEHRSDHQSATAAAVRDLKYVHVAGDEEDLKKKVRDIIYGRSPGSLHKIGPYASTSLLSSIRKEIGL